MYSLLSYGYCPLLAIQWLLFNVQYHSQPGHDQLHGPGGCHISQWIPPQQCLAGSNHMSEQCHRRTANRTTG